MKTPRIVLTALLLLSLTMAGQAQSRKVSDEPGYCDLDWIEIPDGALEVQDIDLSAILQSVAADAKDNGDESLAKVLEMVRSIHVKGYSIEDGNAAKAQKDVDKVTGYLKDHDWKRLIYLRDEGEVVSVNTKYDDSDLVGLMIVVFDPEDDVLFANVVGNLDLPMLMKLVGNMDDEGLDDLLEQLDGVQVHVEKD